MESNTVSCINADFRFVKFLIINLFTNSSVFSILLGTMTQTTSFEKPLDVLTDRRTQFYWQGVREHGKKYPSFHWPSVETLLNVIYTYDALMTHFSKELAKQGLSPSAFNILMILSRNDAKTYKQSDLSKLILVSRANITGLIDSLVKKGLVTRGENKKDRRVCMAQITPAGEKLLESFLPSHYAQIEETTSSLTTEEKKELTHLLTKLRQNFFRKEKPLPS